MRRALAFALLAACGDDGASTTDGGADGANGDAAQSCNRTLAAEDRVRYAVIARPYDSNGSAASMYEVLSLSATGTLAQLSPPKLFSLGGRSSFGTVEFTPDGTIGIVAFADNGKLGVFSLADDGTPTVIQSAFESAAYADKVVVDPSGDFAYVVDGNTRDNGGGIYAVTIGCDGTLADRGLLAPARSPAGLALRGDRVVIAARDLLDRQTLGDEVHLADLRGTPMRIAGGDAFGDDDTVMSTMALSADGNTAFVGDGNFAGVNRIGIATLTDTSVTFANTVVDISDPGGIAASPFGDVALVTAAQGNAIFKLDKANGTWRKTTVATTGTPQIPADVAQLLRGQLRGHVWVVENVSIRHLRFTQAGAVEDLGSLSFGSGLQNIPGAIGIQP